MSAWLERTAALAGAVAVAVIVGAGCTPGSPASAPPDPVAELRSAGSTMASLKTVSADVKFGGGVVFEGFTLDSATSKLQLPGDSDTTLKVRQNDFLVDIRVITVGGHVFLKVPFGKFTEVTPDQAAELPNLGALFDRQRGLPAILPAGTGTRRVGTEKIGDVECDKITTTYTAEQVGQVLGGFKPAGDIAATLWVSPGDHLLRRVVLSGPLVEAGKTATVQVDLHDFNAPVSIVQPTP